MRSSQHAHQGIARFGIDPEASFPGAFADRLRDFGSRARSVIDDAADVVLAGGDVETAHAALADRDGFVSDIEALDRELYDHDAPEEACVVGLVLDSLGRTAAYGGNVASVAIQ